MKKSDRINNGDSGDIEINAADVETGTQDAFEEKPAEEALVTIPRSEYETLLKETARLKEQYLLAAADFENFKKRTEKEKIDIVCFANEKLIYDLLPILDNLQRALSMELDSAGMQSVLEGVRMVNDQLHSVLSSCGLEPLHAVGMPFDPQQHEAIGVLPSEEHKEGTVVSELQRGYKLKGRVLRPSMVNVAGQGGRTRDSQGDE